MGPIAYTIAVPKRVILAVIAPLVAAPRLQARSDTHALRRGDAPAMLDRLPTRGIPLPAVSEGLDPIPSAATAAAPSTAGAELAASGDTTLLVLPWPAAVSAAGGAEAAREAVPEPNAPAAAGGRGGVLPLVDAPAAAAVSRQPENGHRRQLLAAAAACKDTHTR